MSLWCVTGSCSGLSVCVWASPGLSQKPRWLVQRFRPWELGCGELMGNCMILWSWVGKTLSCKIPKVIAQILSWSFTGGKILAFFTPECETVVFLPNYFPGLSKGNPAFIEGLWKLWSLYRQNKLSLCQVATSFQIEKRSLGRGQLAEAFIFYQQGCLSLSNLVVPTLKPSRDGYPLASCAPHVRMSQFTLYVKFVQWQWEPLLLLLKETEISESQSSMLARHLCCKGACRMRAAEVTSFP